MYGSCCEEQEAKEAEVRSKLRAGTAFNEARLMRTHKLRQDVQRALHFCPNSECCAGCGDCEDEEETVPAKQAPPTTSEDDDGGVDSFDDSDDADEAELMAKLRAQRMGQLQSEADAASRQRAARGAHRRTTEGESVAALLSDAADPSPVFLHLALMEDDRSSESCVHVEQALRKLAPRSPLARLITHVCATRSPPDGLPDAIELPALVLVERGTITSVCDQPIGMFREAEQVEDAVSRWLLPEHSRLMAAHARSREKEDDSEEEEDAEIAVGYCGRPGCRLYPHEHDAGAVLRNNRGL